jgi:hypothetical protein
MKYKSGIKREIVTRFYGWFGVRHLHPQLGKSLKGYIFTIPMIHIYREKVVSEYNINKVIKSQGFDYQSQGFDNQSHRFYNQSQGLDYNYNYMEIYSNNSVAVSLNFFCFCFAATKRKEKHVSSLAF